MIYLHCILLRLIYLNVCMYIHMCVRDVRSMCLLQVSPQNLNNLFLLHLLCLQCPMTEKHWAIETIMTIIK